MWLAVDKDSTEWLYNIEKPVRTNDVWFGANAFEVPKGTIKRLLNYPLTWEDEAEYIEGWE